MIGMAMTNDDSILLCSFFEGSCGYVAHEFHWYLGQRPAAPSEKNVMVVKVCWS